VILPVLGAAGFVLAGILNFSSGKTIAGWVSLFAAVGWLLVAGIIGRAMRRRRDTNASAADRQEITGGRPGEAAG